MNQVDKSSVLANAATATSDYTSLPYHLNGLKEFSIHVKFSSSGLGGTLVLQGSNDPTVETDPSSADWVNIADSSQTVTSGASHVWNVSGAQYKYTRFKWTRSAGTGTLTAWLEVKFLEG